jgi:hypothetical protein
MIEAILEFLIVFEDFILGRKKKSDKATKPQKKSLMLRYFLAIIILITAFSIAYHHISRK